MSDIKHIEHLLGFETEFVLPEGLPSEKIVMIQTKNTRRTSEIIEERIERYWQKRRENNMFDGDRPRLEGIRFKENKSKLEILYSHEKFKTYFYTGNRMLPKAYQARPFSVNGIVITRDGNLLVGFRKDEGIWDIVPAGYVDMRSAVGKTTDKEALRSQERWYCEIPQVATARELNEELAIPDGRLDVRKMRLVGILFNYSKYYDSAHAAAIVIPVRCDSSEIELRGNEHETIRFMKVSLKDLKGELIQLSRNPSASSGNLRGDIALTIAHLYGYSEYVKTLKSVCLDISKGNPQGL